MSIGVFFGEGEDMEVTATAGPVQLIIAALVGFGLLLLLIVKYKVHALIAILIATGVLGALAGLSPAKLLEAYQTGTTNVLSGLALVVGLGSMLGAVLDHSGGTNVLARKMIGMFGEKYAVIAIGITSFLIGIPVFWDAAFIIMLPIAFSLARQTGKNAVPYIFAVSSGVAVGQIIPPTPLPMILSSLLDIPLGDFVPVAAMMVIPMFLIMVLLVPWIVSKMTFITPPAEDKTIEMPVGREPGLARVIIVILAPLVLIMFNTLAGFFFAEGSSARSLFQFIGTPFIALTIANVLAIILLGVMEGIDGETIEKVMSKGLNPVATIVLVTAGGGVFRYMLVFSGMADMIGNAIHDTKLPLFVAALILGILFRISVGSQMVAMTMVAGIFASLPQMRDHSIFYQSLLAITLSQTSGAFSHVNDSGFWLFKGLVNVDVKTTFRTWTLVSGLNGIFVFALCWAISQFV